MHRVHFFAAAGLAALASACAMAQPTAQPAPWPAIDAEGDADAAELDRLVRDFPESGGLLRRRAAAAIEAGDSEAARAAITRFAERGGNFSPAGREQIRPLFEEAAWAALAARMDANSAPSGRSGVVSTIPAQYEIIEGYLPSCGNYEGEPSWATSVIGRQLLRSTDGGANWAPVALPADTGSLFGIAGGGNELWIASAVVDQTPNPEGAFRGLIRYTPETGAVERFAAPEGGAPGDIALGNSGAVYAADGLNGAIYRRAPGSSELAVFVPPGTFRSTQGMVELAEVGVLIVADYRFGLAAVDLETGAVSRIASDVPALLDGIDGMARGVGDTLIAVRNGTAPMAILKIVLSVDASRVERVDILERANPAWGEPTLISTACRPLEDIAYYVSDSQWERYPDGYTATPAELARPTRIRGILLYEPENPNDYPADWVMP